MKESQKILKKILDNHIQTCYNILYSTNGGTMNVNMIFSYTDLMEIAEIKDKDFFWELFLKANKCSNSTQEFARRFSLSLGDKFLSRCSEKFEKTFRTPHIGYERTEEVYPVFSSFEEFMLHRACYNTFRHDCAKHYMIGIHNIECLQDLRGSKSDRVYAKKRDKFFNIIQTTEEL